MNREAFGPMTLNWEFTFKSLKLDSNILSLSWQTVLINCRYICMNNMHIQHTLIKTKLKFWLKNRCTGILSHFHISTIVGTVLNFFLWLKWAKIIICFYKYQNHWTTDFQWSDILFELYPQLKQYTG